MIQSCTPRASLAEAGLHLDSAQHPEGYAGRQERDVCFSPLGG